MYPDAEANTKKKKKKNSNSFFPTVLMLLSNKYSFYKSNQRRL